MKVDEDPRLGLGGARDRGHGKVGLREVMSHRWPSARRNPWVTWAALRLSHFVVDLVC